VAHHEDERTMLDGVLNMLVENGLDVVAEATAFLESPSSWRARMLRKRPMEITSTPGWVAAASSRPATGHHARGCRGDHRDSYWRRGSEANDNTEPALAEPGRSSHGFGGL